MLAGVGSLTAAGAAGFGFAPRIAGRELLVVPSAQFMAFVFGVALISTGAVFRRFDHILKAATDAAHDATKDSQAQ
jgi:hypothetical protein